MPELPEVETMRRGILPVVGARVGEVQRPACKKRPIVVLPRIDRLSKRMSGREIIAIDRLGKRVVIMLDDGQALVIEPRMTGLVLLSEPPGLDHLRLRIELLGCVHRELLFWDRRGLGTVRLLMPAELEHLKTQKLGPDALRISVEELRQKLDTSRRAIKVALLDQRAVAGIGNLYASEILFLAGVDPRQQCDRLSGPQWHRIHHAIGLILREAIEHEGSTLSDGTYRNALNDPGGYQNHHRVYDLAATRCKRCDEAEICRIVQAGRSTFYCPNCQKRRGLHRKIAAEN